MVRSACSCLGDLRHGWLILALLAATAACGAEDESPAVQTGGGGGAGGGSGGSAGGQLDVVWEPCSLYDGADDGLAECATAAMARYWDDPGGGTFEVRAKRLLAGGEAEAQLWLLHGGPGASGTIGFPARMEMLQAAYPELDLYTLDHRGTGYSGRLGCAEQEAEDSPSSTSISSGEMPACMAALQEQWGADLAAVTTTFSAMDLSAYIEATREADKRVLVWGGSYGSYWAHRYLQVAPDQADGVTIEGIAPADATFISYDENGNRAAEDFFDLCAADTVCGTKLGPDPWQRLGAALDSLGQGHCASLGLNRRTFSLLLAYVLYYGPTNSVAPALVYRLERCDSADRDAIVSAWNFHFGDSGVWDIASYSMLLQHHITFSEMWDHPDFEGVDLAQYFADIRDTTYVAKNSGAYKLALSHDWPTYADPAHDNLWATTNTPLLMLQGRVDPATTWVEAQKLESHFTAAHQHFVVFAQAPHNVSTATPLSAGWDDHCGQNLFLAFLKDPTATLDLSCVDQVLPIDFGGTTDLSQALLGTADFWENVAPSAPPPQPGPAAPGRAELQRRLAALPRPQVTALVNELLRR
ncbi:MAG: alpha/beta fold hydrolase [Deltaproteobacteria bacterium]|nr:alpha/beta fold hydrolase [Deltaproteobacteria bacterium]